MFNPLDKSIICDRCHRTLVKEATEEDFKLAPIATETGETYCSEEHMAQRQKEVEQDWRDLKEAGAVVVRRSADDDDETPGDSGE